MRGIISGWLKLSLTWRAVSVQPADAVYSPADNVVGIAIDAHARRLDLRAPRRAVGRDLGAVVVELRRLGDPVAETKADHLGGVGDRPAAEGHEQIGAGVARRICRLDHIGPRRVRADLGADPGDPVSQHLAQPVDGVGLAGERAAGEDEHRAGVEAIDLLRQRFGKGLAEDDAFHRRKSIDAAQHRSSPENVSARDSRRRRAG